MNLLYLRNVLYISKRFSRSSIVHYRKRKSLLTPFKSDRNVTDNNVLAKATLSIEQIVPVRPDKTVLTIDAFSKEDYARLTPWRRNQLVKRARRILPLPISLTTDEQIGKIWKQRYPESLVSTTQLENAATSLDDIPYSIRLMVENDIGKFKLEYPALYEKFSDIIEKLEVNEESDVVKFDPNEVASFPFSATNLPAKTNKHKKNSVYQEVFDVNKALLDKEYQDYRKHREMIQYITKNLNENLPINELNPEVEAWSAQSWIRNYGKPDSTIRPSKVPCRGCGAHLHCVATNIPGFMPVEKFTLFSKEELRSQVCQRCDFLSKYNMALNVTVPHDEYPKLISQINLEPSLVIVLVDLLDFPCSVWPNLINLIGVKQKIYIVGNKVDLLPKDDQFYLEGIKKSLKESLKLTGISRDTKIRDVCLISAKTGFGIETLVTKLIRDSKSRQNIYVVGCTNAGKSTLFNALMQSDLCALREGDLMLRATTSVWPGTTLNLLKFPVRKLSAWQLELRQKRLLVHERAGVAERRLKWTMHRQTEQTPFALLFERIDSTFRSNIKRGERQKPFNLREHKASSFLHDTPGVIYKDQLLDLLTTEELLRTLPREIITPRTFTLRPMQTLFIGGLARIDLANARQHVWITVFASQYLPINIVYTEQARAFYESNLGTETFAVPIGNQERLDRWPSLCPREFTLNSVGWERACADIVLSTVGWVSITSGLDNKCIIRAFTPEARGIYTRDPPLLPFASRLRGKRIINTPCFENKLYTVDDFVGDSIHPGLFPNKNIDHISQYRIQKAIRFVKN